MFFGRESEIDDLLRRLRHTRFLAVVGTSGSGKSSLVRSGLIPALQSGYMAGASSTWRMAVMRPGEDPIGHLATALSRPDVLGISAGEELSEDADDVSGTARVLLEATLRRSQLGLVNAVRQARIPSDENVLVLVDQFEELFRFRRSRHTNLRDEAIAFVRLLLEAARQSDVPVYIVLTMRSDFIGDCMNFPGLSDAVNSGLYLVGRMSRDALRQAITGPVAVGGGAIAPRLVNRVLNDLGDDHDQLPRVQHALMRTWQQWERAQTSGAGHGPIDLDDYEAVGAYANALSEHAEEAYQDAVTSGGGRIAELVFKALTDTVSDARGVRRPTCLQDLAAISHTDIHEVTAVIEMFRRSGRSFLTPLPAVPLTPRSIIDISHESLMRCWTRLITWAEEERASAEFYTRLSRASAWFDAGTAGLWRNPELELALRWKAETQPTGEWARRYDDGFERALSFIGRSLEQRDREEAERERGRQAALRRARWTAGVLASFLLVAVSLSYYAFRENARAGANLALARAAVDESLSSADRDPARVGGDVPQVEEFRRELLTKAETFYRAIMTQEPSSEASRRDLALAHFRLGHINRMLEKPELAASEYRDAIARFDALATAYPNNADYAAALANAYNWLGETLRPNEAKFAEAQHAYDSALALQQKLVAPPAPPADRPPDTQRREELARTLYNRGILRYTRGLTSGQSASMAAAEQDFRAAISHLEPIATASDRAAQELARAYNNLGGLLDQADPNRRDEVRTLWQQAIALDERLALKEPANREYALELAQYCNNLAVLLLDRHEIAEANRRSRQAVELIDMLARVAPSLAILRADAHSLRGMILESQDAAASQHEYAVALDLFEQLRHDQRARNLAEFHLRFADLLLNLAQVPGTPAEVARARQLLGRAADIYADLADRIAVDGSTVEAQSALDNLTRVLPELPDPPRARLTTTFQQLQHRLREGPARR